jgi:hypothetical protein
VILFNNFYLVMDVGDVPIPLPNVKASILRPVSFHINFFFRSLNSFIL